MTMEDEMENTHEANEGREALAVIRRHMPNLEAAANPMKSEVFVLSGGSAREMHDAIVALASTAQTASAGEPVRSTILRIRDNFDARRSAAEWAGKPLADVDDMLIGLQKHYDALAAIPTTDAGDWVLVPREPTEAMLAAGRTDARRSNRYEMTSSWLRNCWSAMLAAAPSPPTDATQLQGDDAALYEAGRNYKAGDAEVSNAEVERVARAMRDHACKGLPELPFEWWAEQARAAIAAMRKGEG
jgi:hypothetical protein